MEYDRIYLVWKKHYSYWWIKYITKELRENELEISLDNMIKVFNLIEFDELEKYLFNQYWLQFIKKCLYFIEVNEKV